MVYEKRLIDANALDNKLETLKVRFKAQGRDAVAEDYNFVQTVLLTAPTVDAVEVVRCKDCKHWIYTGDGFGDCTNKRFHIDDCPDPTMKADEFCCLGERTGDQS